ncbi:MAG TPA: aldehyde ferredoxin oxidoreductase family protein [Thermoleophilia bacterium]|nr:aldehyde ferredoxin oxidoreductase family protein [Thermoleophilia bacterium]
MARATAIGGWQGRLLRVDLERRTASSEPIDRAVLEKYVGGRGLGVWYLSQEVDPKVDPLSPDNKLIFATGPLTGTSAPAGSRQMLVTKSPLTGAIATSNTGGYFGAEMKFAGYDVVIVEKAATAPVYLWIEDDRVEFHSAEDVWGREVSATTDILVGETHEEAKVMCIGPAGENLVKISAIMNDMGRAAGRSGVGAVMGSKKLKAIVVRGTQGIRVADPAGFVQAVQDVRDHELLNQFMTVTVAEYGTSDVVEFSNEFGLLPTRNFQQGTFEGAAAIGGTAVSRYNLKGIGKTKACFGCPTACGRVTAVENGRFKGRGEGPEYETLGSLGAVCGISDLEAVLKSNYLCNELGMDTISAGVTMACAMELVEKGYVSEDEVGRPLSFGDGEAVVELLQKTALREGFGDALAEGSYRLADGYGHPELSMTVKKLEFPNYDPRGGNGFALAYATQSRGACHIRNEVHCVEFFGISLLGITQDEGENVDRFTSEGKAEIAKQIQDYYCMIDSSGMCNFLVIAMPHAVAFMGLIEKATGIDFGGLDGFLRAGEAIFNLERLFNLGAGLTSADDTLPRRMLEEPFVEGASKGHVPKLDVMLPEYYALRGWDGDGVPTPERLAELGVGSVAAL